MGLQGLQLRAEQQHAVGQQRVVKGLDSETVAGQEEGLAELSAKIFGHKTDRITLKESVILRGERSRGLIKTRVVLEGEASAEITGITDGDSLSARIDGKPVKVRIQPPPARAVSCLVWHWAR